MKKLNILYSLLAFIIVFSSCKDDKDGITRIPLQEGAAVILSPNGSTSYTLLEENSDAAFETFIWEDAYFGEGVTPEYTVEMDLATGDFSNAVVLGTSDIPYLKTTIGPVNQFCRDLGVMARIPTGFQARVKATAGGDTKYSIPVNFLIDRFIYADEVATWMVVGSGIENPVALMLDTESGMWKSTDPIQLKEGGISFMNNNVYQDELGADSDISYEMEMSGSLIDSDGKEIPSKDFTYNITLDVEGRMFTVAEDTHYTATGSAVVNPDVRFKMEGDSYELKTRFVAGTFLIKFNSSSPMNYGVTSATDNTLIVDGEPIEIATDGNYKVTVDADMKVTVEESAYPNEMYIVGSATAYGWDEPGTHEDAIMHKVAGGADNEGLFWKIAHLEGGQGFKISAEAWNDPNLGFDQVDEFDPDGVEVVNNDTNMGITTSGMYTIVVDLRENATKVSVTPAQVYGMGPAFGGWDEDKTENLFTVDNTEKTIISPALSEDGDIRSYVNHAWIPAWWQAEFQPKDESILYRNDGGDLPNLGGTAGTVITYKFDDNTSSIQ
ncbi:SusF/SusE family outer membrane protein [Saccharicrinis aurantiacus]|uniref:SusF/SusE family outer membrane protein n=1 Tax=Saccharicrinis aurantiacus TaxID=1849719 RepID=UPI002491A0DF|nr:SusE domain-containing protein [Saccharicrinis aurantiacus]